VYAVVETGGKQYKVSEGQIIEVEKLPYEVGETVRLDRVLLIADRGERSSYSSIALRFVIVANMVIVRRILA